MEGTGDGAAGFNDGLSEGDGRCVNDLLGDSGAGFREDEAMGDSCIRAQ
jgi:hypothetical protein